MHASQRRIYYAVQAGCFHSYQTAGDCGRRKCGGIDRTCPDQEDEISQGPDMGLCGIGIVLLAAVFVLAKTSYGAKLSLMGIQPSEAIKITFVFFMAALLRKGADFSKVVQATVVAGLHVGILVLSRDLGSAVIFFAAYLVMIYVASRNVGYLALGLAGGSAGAVVAYHLFGHVRQRVTAWKDPMAVYQNEGYQIVQSLFAIGTGGWFGMGLCQGSPEKIPVVKNDFIFSAICEELGGFCNLPDFGMYEFLFDDRKYCA